MNDWVQRPRTVLGGRYEIPQPQSVALTLPLLLLWPGYHNNRKGYFFSWISFLVRPYDGHALEHSRVHSPKQVMPLFALAQCHWKLLANPKHLLFLSAWATVSKQISRQRLFMSRLMIYLKVTMTRIKSGRTVFLFPRMKNTAKCQLFLVKLAELQLLTVLQSIVVWLFYIHGQHAKSLSTD